jgi:hypothetical protein
MWAALKNYFDDRGWCVSVWSLSGRVRVRETATGTRDLRVGIERYEPADADSLIAAVAESNVAPPVASFISVGSVLTGQDGVFELTVRGAPREGEVDVLTLRPPAVPGVSSRLLFAQRLSVTRSGSQAMVIDLPVAALIRAGVQVTRDGANVRPNVSGLLRAAGDRARSTPRSAQPYSQRYGARFDAAIAQEGDRMSVPARRGPSLAVPANVRDAAAPVHDIAVAVARLAGPGDPIDGVTLLRDEQSGDVTIRPAVLPLLLRRPIAAPDPFAQRRLEALWAAPPVAATDD